MSDQEHQMSKHGQICWTEVATNNLEEADAFYTEIFGWEIRSDNNPAFEYRHFTDGCGRDVGGMYELNPEMTGGHDVPAHFMTYISVDDVDETVEKIKAKGGSIVREPMDVPNTGRMAVAADPSGAHFAIIKLSGHE